MLQLHRSRALTALFGAFFATSIALAADEDDPYLWLEDVLGEQALSWVKERNATSTGELTADPAFNTTRDRILSILDSNEKIPYVYKQGKHFYNFWKDAEHVRGVWRRTTLDSYRTPNPSWEVVIDVDALGKAENESWVWHGANCLAPKYERCLVSLSRGGADASVVREFDMKTRSFVEGGFVIPESKSDYDWIDRDTLIVGVDLGPDTLTTSGYPRQARVWKRGTELASSTVLFEGQSEDVSAWSYHDDEKGWERTFVGRSPTFFTNELYEVVDGKPVKIDKPDDAEASVARDRIYLLLRSDWKVGEDRYYVAGSLLTAKYDAYKAGDRSFDILFAPDAKRSLDGYLVTKHHVVLTVLDNVRSRVEIFTPGKKGWTHRSMGGLPEFASIGVSAVDAEKSDELFITVSDYLTPTTLYLGSANNDGLEKLKQLPAFFNTEGLEISQHEATSEDGTKIPYFQVSRKGVELNGKNPTLLYGYGGFEVSLLPNYSATIGASWLERGGVYVLANIRGGGEFGPAWHQAALKQNRNKAYEDFAAVAKDLASRQVADADHLGIQGGSNGGLLMGNMLTSYPDLFEAVVCQVPLLDMKRFNKLLAGASWMGEYGNPDVPEEWAWLQRYSPYHKVQAEVTYPRVLFTTSTRDDRVHPGHARKMAARMLEQGHDILYYENIEGGHGGAADNKQASFMQALSYTFLWRELQ